jgi:carboxymethylenebutenolidase
VLSLYPPPGVPRGGVVAVHEVFGVDGWFAGFCASIAADGWLVVAPHLFHRTGDPVPADLSAAGPHLDALTTEGVLADVDVAVSRLMMAPDRVGIVGSSLGGNVALAAAAARSLGAAVTFYGGGITRSRLDLPPGLSSAGALQTPWLGLYGERDASTPGGDLDDLEEVIGRSAVDAAVVRYPDAGHGFLRRDGHAAEDGRRRAMEWLTSYLKT